MKDDEKNEEIATEVTFDNYTSYWVTKGFQCSYFRESLASFIFFADLYTCTANLFSVIFCTP